MADFKLGVVITATDKITKPVQKITTTLAKITSPIRAVRSSFRRLGRDSQLPELSSRARNFGSSLTRLGSEAGAMARRSILAFTGIGTAAFLAVKKITGLGDATAKTADRMGVSVEQFEKWKFAAERSGISTGEFTVAIQKLQRQAVNAEKDTSGAAAGIFKALDVDIGSIKDTPELLEAFADGISRIEDPLKRNAVLMEIMGRSGTQMATLLTGGSEGIQKLGDEAVRVGAVLGEDFARQSEVTQDRLTNLSSSVTGLGASLFKGLLPGINAAIPRLTEWIGVNKELIGSQVGEFVAGFIAPFKALGEEISTVSSFISGKLNISLGGFKTLGTVVAVLAGVKLAAGFASFSLALFDTVKNFVLLGIQMVKTAVLMTGSMIRGIVGLAGSLVSALLPGIISATSGMWAFTASLLANPIVQVVGLVALLAGGVFLLVRHWAPVTAFFSRLWSGVTKAFTFAVSAIANVLTGFLNTVRTWLANLLGFDLVSVGAQFITGLLDGFTLAWSGVTSFFSGAVSGIDNFVNDLFGFSLIDVGANLVDGFLAGIQNAWTGVTGFLSGAISNIASLIPDSIKGFLGIGETVTPIPLARTPIPLARTPIPLARTPIPLARTPIPSAALLRRRERQRENDRVPGALGGQIAAAGLPTERQVQPEFRGKMVIDFQNAPRGTRIVSKEAGGSAKLDVDTGLSFAIP